MAKTTEELKREMYACWSSAMRWVSPYSSESSHLQDFESAMEAYLEALRQESIHQQSRLELNESLANGFSGQVEAANKLVSSYRGQCDTLRNKLQAFEFANRSAAELLSEALREPSGLRKPESCALAKSSKENASCDIPEALLRCPAHFIQTNCKQGHHFMVNSSGPDGGLHCLACGHHREIPQ